MLISSCAVARGMVTGRAGKLKPLAVKQKANRKRGLSMDYPYLRWRENRAADLSVVILQLHVNRLMQFASFCFFLSTFLT